MVRVTVVPSKGPFFVLNEASQALHCQLSEVAQLLALLPERTREVLIMRRVEGLSQQETATD